MKYEYQIRRVGADPTRDFDFANNRLNVADYGPIATGSTMSAKYCGECGGRLDSQWLESASDVDLTDEVSTLLPDATIHGPRWQIALHAVNHSTLHRGQIITMLRTVGIPPPNTDLTSYLTAAQRPRHHPEKDLS